MDVRGKKVTVVGLGRTSLALVKLLLREGASVYVTEAASGPGFSESERVLAELGVAYECGGHTDAAFSGAEMVIPSPGVPPTIDAIRAAVDRGAVLAGEMEFAATRCTSKIIAVTGTNGKTTTTELIHAMARGAGVSVGLAGNNAVPLSEAVQAPVQPDYLVLEVSSYQLETARSFAPWIGVLLNVTPDHLARHSDLETYLGVKARLFANQGRGDFAILNYDDAAVRGVDVPEATDRTFFSQDMPLDGGNAEADAGMWVGGETIYWGGDAVCGLADVPLRGRHNLENVLAALCVCRAAGFDFEGALGALRAFRGVEHRIEHVADIEGVAYYNDSKSTNVESLRVALESFEEAQPIVLIAGGRGKGDDYGALSELVASRVSRMIVIGEDAPVLARVFGDITEVSSAAGLAEAVRAGSDAARAGDVVLFSPGCASFDMFENFEHRGHVFKDAVEHLGRGAAANSGA